MTDNTDDIDDIDEKEEPQAASAEPEKSGKQEKAEKVEKKGMKPSRRRFLKATLWGGGILAVLATLPAIQIFRASYPKAGIPLKTFSDKEFHILKHAAMAIIPRGGAFKIGAEDVQPEVFIDEYFHDFPGLVRKGIKLLLILFEHSPILFEGTLKTFTMLRDDDKEAYLRGWEESKSLYKRKAFGFLKGIVCVGFYSDPRVLKEIGYEYPC